MALGAIIPGFPVSTAVNRKILIVMIPGSLIPAYRVMAILTMDRETRSGMVRIIRIIILVFMTGKTIGWESGILSIDVTISAVYG
jgi:hypothetical protein